MIEYEGSRVELLRILADMGEEPAFIARARAPAVALDALVRACKTARYKMLTWPRIHFASLRERVAGDWSLLQPLLGEQHSVGMLRALDAELQSDKRMPISLLTTDKRMLITFLNSAKRFNRNWLRYLQALNLEQVNKPRQDYNRYYLIEIACAFGHERHAEGFEALNMIDSDYLKSRIGLLKLPTLAAGTVFPWNCN